MASYELQRSRKSRCWRSSWLFWPMTLALLFSTLATGCVVGILYTMSQDLPDVYRAEYRPNLSTKIFAANGEIIATLYEENRELIPLERIPPLLIQATLAIEDARFYQHPGIDPRGILRAVRENLGYLRTRDWGAGGSTITQQLARTLYLSRAKKLERKVREAILAVRMERAYSKDEILEMYLNTNNYGEGAYGVATAAYTYFRKKVEDLTLAECALLAGMPQSPSHYSPFRYPDQARRRRMQVLRRMREVGYISLQEEQEANQAPLPEQPSAAPYRRSIFDFRAPYFTTQVIQDLQERLGLSKEQIYRNGLRVYTTVDLNLYAAADRILRSHLRELARRGGEQGAVVVLDVKTGQVLTLIGGVNFRDEKGGQFNRATQSRRQPGSAFKPLVYAAAFENGFRPGDVLSGTPTTFHYQGQTYRPKNFGAEQGPYTLVRALQKSVNVVAVRLNLEVGPAKVVDLAYRMGIHSPLQPVLSLALGSIGVSPLEMATVFTAFANGGYRLDPTTILRVEDREGRVIYRAQPLPRRVISEQTAYWLNQMLQKVVEGGTGTRARIAGLKVGGKTGTTTDHKDAWFIGFTPGVVVAVWVGNDAFQPMRAIQGAQVSPICRDILQKAAQLVGANWPDDYPPPPEALPLTDRSRRSRRHQVRAEEEERQDTPTQPETASPDQAVDYQMICATSGLLANQFCPQVEARPFPPGETPSRVCALHTHSAESQRPDQPVPAANPPAAAPASFTGETSAERPSPESARKVPGTSRTGPSRPSEEARINVLICVSTGRIANEYCPEVAIRSFPVDQKPSSVCTRHRGGGDVQQ